MLISLDRSLQRYFYCLILVRCLTLGANLSFVTTVMRRVLQSQSLTWAIRGSICSLKPCAVETRAASRIWFAYECQMTFVFMLGWSNFWTVPWSESKDIKPLKLEGRWVMLKQVVWQARDWHQAWHPSIYMYAKLPSIRTYLHYCRVSFMRETSLLGHLGACCDF